MAKRRKRRDPSSSSKLAESLALVKDAAEKLDRIKQTFPASALQADMVRDTLVDLHRLARRQAKLIRRLRQAREERHVRLVELLHELATGGVILPRTPGRAALPHEQLLATYRRLRAHDFLALAQILHEVIGRGEVPAYLRFLVDEILAKGSLILVEHMIRQAPHTRSQEDEDTFLERLRHHISGNVVHGLGKQVQYQVTPEVGEHIQNLVKTVTRFLTDLLTANPPGRLLVARPETPFDPERHEPIPGRPSTGDLEVRATLFPGYIVLDSPPRIVEKAQVYTEAYDPGEVSPAGVRPPPLPAGG
jgi:hypothetical protein